MCWFSVIVTEAFLMMDGTVTVCIQPILGLPSEDLVAGLALRERV